MFVRYVPEVSKASPFSFDVGDIQLLFIPGETLWLSEGTVKFFTSHSMMKKSIDEGNFKFFKPTNKDANPSDLSTYSNEDFEQIVHGFYDVGKLNQFRAEMSHEDMLSKYIFRDQINKIEKLDIPKHLEYASRMFFSLKLTNKMYVAESKLSPTR